MHLVPLMHWLGWTGNDAPPPSYSIAILEAGNEARRRARVRFSRGTSVPIARPVQSGDSASAGAGLAAPKCGTAAK